MYLSQTLHIFYHDFLNVSSEVSFLTGSPQTGLLQSIGQKVITEGVFVQDLTDQEFYHACFPTALFFFFFLNLMEHFLHVC